MAKIIPLGCTGVFEKLKRNDKLQNNTYPEGLTNSLLHVTDVIEGKQTGNVTG